MKPVFVAATLAVLLVTGKGSAHEFWIDPVQFIIAPGTTLEADLRVGTEFVGTAQSYLPRNFEQFTLIAPDATRPVDGRLGDIPALSADGLTQGLTVVVYESGVTSLTWAEWESFLGFAEHKDLGDITQMQADRGLSQELVREDFIRYAKSLVAVGDGAGRDTRAGMRAELVALSNPYTDPLTDGMRMQLWYDDAPQPDTQVELFAEDTDGNVTITLHRTDTDGIVNLPVAPGIRYMADAVFLEAVEPVAPMDPMWVSHWANMTFAVPQ